MKHQPVASITWVSIGNMTLCENPHGPSYAPKRDVLSDKICKEGSLLQLLCSIHARRPQYLGCSSDFLSESIYILIREGWGRFRTEIPGTIALFLIVMVRCLQPRSSFWNDFKHVFIYCLSERII